MSWRATRATAGYGSNSCGFQGDRTMETHGPTGSWDFRSAGTLPDTLLDQTWIHLPPDGPQDTGSGRDVVRFSGVGLEQCVLEKSFKKYDQPGLAGVEPLGSLEVFEVLMICPHQELLSCSLQPVSPLLQGDFNGQQFSVAVIISCHRG